MTFMQRFFVVVSIILIITINAITTVLGSSGDRQFEFQVCVNECTRSSCEPDNQVELPLMLQLTFWSCSDNCKYNCMHSVTAQNIERGERVHQYFGKWPFTRFLGMQEPASVLFSILNGYGHYRGYRRLRREVPPTSPYRGYYMTNALIAVNGWIWSVVFHARDVRWTERMDYFSAVASITYNCYVAVLKVTSSGDRGVGGTRAAAIRSAAGLLAGAFFTAHVTYLSLWPFDYTYNMIAGVSVGMLSNVLWLYWCWRNRKSRPHVWKMVATVILITSAMCFELVDFPPFLWILDAHSLWHASSWPVIFLFYGFFVDDALYDFDLKRRLL